MMEFKLNYTPDPQDPNDLKFTSVKEKLVKTAAFQDKYAEHIIPEYTPITNQGSIGTCAATSTVDALEILMGLENPNKVTQLSKLFLYWNARVPESKTDQDCGIFLRNAFYAIKTLGVCPEEDWPYLESKIYTQPPLHTYKTASDNTIDSFYRITTFDNSRLDDVESAIRANHPVVFGTAVSREFVKNYDLNYSKAFTPPAEEQIYGYHAMVITGVRYNGGKREFLVRNSWGKNWGLKGHCWFDESYINYTETSDLWVPTRMPELLR